MRRRPATILSEDKTAAVTALPAMVPACLKARRYASTRHRCVGRRFDIDRSQLNPSALSVSVLPVIFPNNDNFKEQTTITYQLYYSKKLSGNAAVTIGIYDAGGVKV